MKKNKRETTTTTSITTEKEIIISKLEREKSDKREEAKGKQPKKSRSKIILFGSHIKLRE